MEGVPSPLQIGSPAAARNPSDESNPSALPVGSPAAHTPRPPLTREGASGGSDRLSQLFPSRPSSVASISPAETHAGPSRRTSYPSPLVPAAESSYQIPRAPAPPTFSDDPSYNPTPDPFANQGAQPALRSNSGTKRLLDRLTSLRRGRSSGTGKYNKLDDESRTGFSQLRGVEEAEEPVEVDLSGFGGVPMKKFEPQKKLASAADAMEQERDLNEAGYAAEYERLEAQLGSGMSSIVEVPFTHNSTQPEEQPSLIGHRRGISHVDIGDVHAKDAQHEAEMTGGIVAVSEVPVDISDSFGGADFETRSIMTTNNAENKSQTSYYFPPDPDMPSWRPFTMGWPWISILIVVALSLAAVQEVLCQLSISRSKEKDLDGGNNNGLVQFRIPNDLSVGEFFIWKYAPIMFFVIYGICWQMVDFEVKRLEPYYQLSKKTGATAGESLNMDYLTFMSWLVPLRALRHKQYAVIYVSLATLVASSLVPVLQSASVEMYPPREERTKDSIKSIRIDPPWSRAVTASLVFVAAFGGVLMYEMRRKSGLQSDPKGIAGVAAMATKSHILADFRGLDTAPLQKIHKQLRHRRYILHKSSLWQGEFIRNSTEKMHEHGSDPRPLMLRLEAGVPYTCYLVLFAILIPIFTFVKNVNQITDKVPFILTALATGVRLVWNTMNCDVRMLEPFYILANRKAPAKTLTLDYTGTNPIVLPIKSGLNKHWIVALVGFGSILGEMLTVCVSAFSVDGTLFIPGHGNTDMDQRVRRDDNDDDDKNADSRYSTDQTFRSFWISLVLVMIILAYLISIAVLVQMRRSKKFMPRQIGTMASVLAFIHQSKMLVSFVDTETKDSSQMTRHLEQQGKTYGLGWFSGRDGDDHLGIDEEPLLADYTYGVDWTKTRMLGHQIGMWEHY